jgi:hypothetical protein
MRSIFNSKISSEYRLSYDEQQLIFHKFDKIFKKLSGILYDKFLFEFSINTGRENCFFTGHKDSANLFFKAIELSSFLSEHDDRPSFECFSEELDFFNENMDVSRFACMYSLLASNANNIVDLIDLGPYPYKINPINDTKTSSKILKVINLPLNIILDKIARKFIPNGKRRAQINIFTLGENELTKEVKAYKNKQINFIEIRALLSNIYIETDSDYKYFLHDVNAVVGKIFNKILNEYKITESLKKSYCLSISQILSHQISKLTNSHLAMYKLVRRLKEKHGCNVSLGNGMFGVAGIAMYNALSKNGIVVVCSEHGLTTGLSKYIKETIDLYEPRTADYILTYSQSSSETFLTSLNKNLKCIQCGAPYETKNIRYKFLQRLVARARIKAKGVVIFYASMNLLTNNNRFFPVYPDDEYRFEKEMLILSRLISKIGKNFIYKQYPSQNYLYKESPYIIEAKKHKNITIAQEEDFRYVRTAADIIVTADPSSTLGWCIGADVPLVFLGSKKYHALEDEKLWEIFNECFFVIDIDCKSWEEEFVSLLNMSMSEILFEWKEKKKKYQAYDEQYFLGMNKNAGKIGSDLISNLANNEN